MPTKKKAPKYANPKSVVKGGFRRVSKQELKALGYSTRSALYTKADARYPSKFLTRSDIRKVQKPLQDSETFETYKFSLISKQRIRATRRKLFRYTYTVYADFMVTITLEQAIALTEKFFEFLQRKHHPVFNSQIGMIYKGTDDDFSLQPRYWRDRQNLIVDQLRKMIRKYKAKMQIIFIIGWIEQSS